MLTQSARGSEPPVAINEKCSEPVPFVHVIARKTKIMTALEPAPVITSLDQLDPAGVYSYADYLLWQFQERVELLKGKLFPMAAPSTYHQDISGQLHLAIGT